MRAQGAHLELPDDRIHLVGRRSASSPGSDLPLVVDVGSGLLAPDRLLPDEPDIAGALRSGADVVTASGDKLLGGPQAGLIAGGPTSSPGSAGIRWLARLRVDKLTLAALEATLDRPATPTAVALAR